MSTFLALHRSVVSQLASLPLAVGQWVRNGARSDCSIPREIRRIWLESCEPAADLGVAGAREEDKTVGAGKLPPWRRTLHPMHGACRQMPPWLLFESVIFPRFTARLSRNQKPAGDRGIPGREPRRKRTPEGLRPRASCAAGFAGWVFVALSHGSRV